MASLLRTSCHGTLFHQQKPSVWLLTWLIGSQCKSTNINAIDSFISELVENKSLKWKVLKSRQHCGQPVVPQQLTGPSFTEETINRTSFRLSKLFTELTQNPLVLNISKLNASQLNNLLATALNEQNKEDVNLLLTQMLQFKKIPSFSVLTSLIRHLAHLGEKQKLEQLIELVSSHCTAKGQLTGCGFDHYRALCQWKLGNTFKSLEGFRGIISVCSDEELIIVDHMLLDMIDETIGKKSEAVLLAVIRLCEYCITELKHELPICYVWEKSFQSPWHSDQEVAKTLFDRHVLLRNSISKRLRNLCFKMLYNRNVENVYQLLELFLKHDMKAECKFILIRLFEYQYWLKNLRGCSEIMQNAIDLNITLPEMYNRHLLELLLGRTSMRSSPLESLRNSKKLKPNKYELKF